MEELEIGNRPIAYKKDYRGNMYESPEGKWVKVEDAQEMLDWVRVLVHTAERGVDLSSLRGIAAVVKNRLHNITWNSKK